MLAWFADKVLPALVVFVITTPVTIVIANARQTRQLKRHVDRRLGATEEENADG